MNTQQKINAKPSQAYADESILRAKADAANRKRKARQQHARWEEPKVKPEPQPEPEVKPEPKVNSTNLGKKIKVECDGIEYPTINAALRGTGEELWQNENDFRRSCWTKINRAIKTKGEFAFMGHTFKAI